MEENKAEERKSVKISTVFKRKPAKSRAMLPDMIELLQSGNEPNNQILEAFQLVK